MRPNMHYQKGADGKDDILLPTPSLGLRVVKRRCDELGGIDGYNWERITQNFGQSSDRSSDKKSAPITRKYGNSAIFVCSYVDCLHIAHADMQAAYNIAIRGYLREYEQRSLPKNAPKKGRFSTDKFAEWQQELEYAPVGLGRPTA